MFVAWGHGLFGLILPAQLLLRDLNLGWAVLLFVKSSRIIILYVCKHAILLINRSVN